MLQVIKAAIERQEMLEIFYPPGKRLIEPHALGYSSEGKLLLRAFQTEGASASGEHKDWKLFRLDRAAGVEPHGILFAKPRSEYRKGDKAMKGGIVSEL